jgi:alkanesulfonate monooxygenase SsuD/methylene tetrahydromethanopterin reductase-like flavin-dependent oxidoreductase (luciferase family)
MLRLAAREADIVSINYNLSEGRVNRTLARSGLAEATDEKLLWIREAAGDRFSEIELAVSIFVANVTDDREAMAEALAPGIGCEPREVLEIPHFLIGTVEQIIEDVKARRERFGISFLAIPGEVAEAFAPVVERLTGA